MVLHGCGQRTSSWGMRFSAQDELFIKRNTVSDGQVASATKESAQHAKLLCRLPSHQIVHVPTKSAP
jgi:hypothetical protein